MMRANLVERQTKVVKVDFDPHAFEIFRDFIHGEAFNLAEQPVEVVFNLRKIADYYLVQGLEDPLRWRLEMNYFPSTIVDMTLSLYRQRDAAQDAFVKKLVMSIAA